MQHEQVLRPLVTEKATKTIEAQNATHLRLIPKPKCLPSRRLSKPFTTCGSFA